MQIEKFESFLIYNKGKYFGQKSEFFPLPNTEIANFFPVFPIGNLAK